MTNAELVWEVFKGLGSMAGLATGAFVIWDRFWRHTPQAIVVSRPLMEGSSNIVARLAIKNLASRPIVISWENGAANHLRLAVDDSIHGIVSSLFEGRKVLAINAEETREFVILRPYNFPDINPDDWLYMRLNWKFAQPILWQPMRKIMVALQKHDFELLDGGKADEDDT